MTSRLSRREFVKRASALSFMGAGAPFALNLASIGAASAQAAPGYRAIVCLFLFGGNDHTNTIIPYDPAEHTEYANARQSIAFARDALTPTATAPVASQGNRPFAFHPALTAFKSLYDQGRLAVVANVGPLVVPTTLAQYRARSVPLPPKLFSHNDQQSVWQANQPVGEGARLGWGGRLGDLLAAQNGQTIFTCISAAGNAVFMSGQEVLQYQVGSNGSIAFNALTGSLYGSSSAGNAYRRVITRASGHLFENQLGQVVSRSISANATLAASLPPASSFTLPIPANNGLASQLNVVARIIAARGGLGTTRQVFFVSAGGYDNHDFLLDEHNRRLAGVNAAVDAFWQWLQQLQMESSVTLFTASDFGRTLTSNGDGSDHGWGAHHFVIGGAVQGGTIYGTFPQVRFGTPEDVGQGNLLPTTSVDQYAATLGRWLGVADTVMPDVLPNVVNFGASRYLGFLA
ncbi:MAG TPA: DUF1501 domain-containing protein [Burkholderiales bacterium]